MVIYKLNLKGTMHCKCKWFKKSNEKKASEKNGLTLRHKTILCILIILASEMLHYFRHLKHLECRHFVPRFFGKKRLLFVKFLIRFPIS